MQDSEAPITLLKCVDLCVGRWPTLGAVRYTSPSLRELTCRVELLTAASMFSKNPERGPIVLRKVLICILILVFSTAVYALPFQTPQEAPKADASKPDQKKAEPWDVEAEHGPSALVEFDTDEGTWMSCDVSPDGQTVVFDLLGDLYRMPVSGGKAELLS